jgi:hypothetical protein
MSENIPTLSMKEKLAVWQATRKVKQADTAPRKDLQNQKSVRFSER